MKQINSSLTTRQFERDDINLPVELTIVPEHRSQVTLSATAAASSSHVISGIAHDISPGGVGIECSQYLPRMCEGVLRVFDNSNSTHTVIFEHRVKVRRVYMTSRQPTYSLGLAFVSPDPDIPDRVADLLASLHDSVTLEGRNHA